MYCNYCGSEVPQGVSKCPNCGAEIQGNEIKGFNPDAAQYGNQYSYTDPTGYTGYTGAPTGPGYEILKTDRKLIEYILFGMFTCGIYDLFFLHQLIKDVNKACEGDGKETPSLFLLILLSIITCGVYSFIWSYQLGNRLAENAARYGYNVVENGTSVLMLNLFGVLLCGVGPYVAMNIIIKNTNLVCTGYNGAHGVYC